MKIHCCLLDGECRELGAPARLNIHGSKRHYTLALTPSARLQKRPYDKRPIEFAWLTVDPVRK